MSLRQPREAGTIVGNLGRNSEYFMFGIRSIWNSECFMSETRSVSYLKLGVFHIWNSECFMSETRSVSYLQLGVFHICNSECFISETRSVSYLLFETLNLFLRKIYSMRRLGSGIYIGCSALEKAQQVNHHWIHQSTGYSSVCFALTYRASCPISIFHSPFVCYLTSTPQGCLR